MFETFSQHTVPSISRDRHDHGMRMQGFQISLATLSLSKTPARVRSTPLQPKSSQFTRASIRASPFCFGGLDSCFVLLKRTVFGNASQFFRCLRRLLLPLVHACFGCTTQGRQVCAFNKDAAFLGRWLSKVCAHCLCPIRVIRDLGSALWGWAWHGLPYGPFAVVLGVSTCLLSTGALAECLAESIAESLGAMSPFPVFDASSHVC